MRRTSILIAACLVAAMTMTLYAQRDIMPVMKEVGPTNQSLGKNIAAGSAADAGKDAEKLQALFKETGEFMKAQKQTDGVGWANDAMAAAAAVSKAAKANDAAGMTAASGNLAKTCMSCHAAHRERVDGAFKYKAPR